MKTIIITGSDENFSPLLLDLISSLVQWQPGLCDAIGVLDLGLSEATLQQVRERVTHIVIPEWDLCVDPTVRDTAPYQRALSARPFLPKYFPGYDIYLWLDADMWLQESYSINWFIEAAKGGDIGIVPELHQSYVLPSDTHRWRKERLYAYFGDRAVAIYDKHSNYNAGAFALRATSPHWDTWARYFEIGLRAAPKLVCDQTALNYAIWNGDITIHPLPALCNWCCHFAVPAVNIDAKKLCEPHMPNRAIGLIHLAAGTKNTIINVTYEGKASEISLRFKGASALP